MHVAGVPRTGMATVLVMRGFKRSSKKTELAIIRTPPERRAGAGLRIVRLGWGLMRMQGWNRKDV